MSEIIQIFAESGFQIDPEALDMIKTSGSPELIHDVLKSIDNSVLVVGIEHIKPMTPEKKIQSPVTILKDITNQSTCIGEYTEFVQYFKDRYSQLGDML
ncbi:MAG: DNA polymerase II small subunit, partial [Euryarchaeota archaeon]|nr:DNA polymerase II small subunit [Euryarchaeota archaeon]